MKKLILIFMFVFLSSSLWAQETLLVASAAGYKIVVQDLVAAYTQKTDTKVDLIFGNMGQIIAQAQTSGKVDLMLGEENFLRASTLALGPSTIVGRGRLVLAWPQGQNTPQDLNLLSMTRIALPDPQRAIYGQAAMEYLKTSGQYTKVEQQLVIVSTVPQILTYLSTGEVDVGFVNLTQVLTMGQSIGGYLEIDPQLYTPILLTCIPLKTAPNPTPAQKFLDFLQTPKAQNIIKAHGL